MLSKGPHKVGLRSLLDVCGLTGKEIDSYHIGFVLAPRVNAAGRMSSPDIAARLLLASDEAMARRSPRAGRSSSIPRTSAASRKRPISFAQARKAVETDLEIGSRTVIVVAGEGWHRGVIGIVASKLVDAFHRPAIVLSIDGDVAHGSCRSIPSFNMLAALESCGEVMSKFGGHKQAAGLTMASDRGCGSCGRGSTTSPTGASQPDDLRPRIWIDGALGVQVDRRAGGRRSWLRWRRSAQATLARSSAPAASRSWTVRAGIKERHLKMAFKQDGRVMRGIAWRASEREEFVTEHRTAIDLAFSLEQDTWNGERYLQLSIADFKAPEN